MRLFEERHAGELFSLIERNRGHVRQWLPWVDKTRSSEDVRAFIGRTLQQFAKNEGFHAGIWVNGALAGGIGCHDIDWGNRNTSLGYWLDASMQGRGIVTRCCRKAIDFLFQDLKLNRVEIRCGTGNTKSCAIPERLGFVREGVVRQGQFVGGRFIDLVVWGMLASEWLSQKARETSTRT